MKILALSLFCLGSVGCDKSQRGAESSDNLPSREGSDGDEVGFTERRRSVITALPRRKSNAFTSRKIAEREVIRRLQRVKDAETEIAEGQRLMKEKDYAAARQKLKAALDKIPDAPLVNAKRDRATQLFADVSVLLADQKAREGRRDEARDILAAVLSDGVYPYNKDARKILVRLDDPAWYNHAPSPEHVGDVASVERHLKVAKGYFDLGDYDYAEQQYDLVLRLDPYNQAARRGQQEVEFQRRAYSSN